MPMRRLLSVWRPASLKVYVDDILLQLHGRRREVTHAGLRMAEACVELVAGVGLEISRGTAGQPGGNSGAMASAPDVQRAIKQEFANLGIHVKDHMP